MEHTIAKHWVSARKLEYAINENKNIIKLAHPFVKPLIQTTITKLTDDYNFIHFQIRNARADNKTHFNAEQYLRKFKNNFSQLV